MRRPDEELVAKLVCPVSRTLLRYDESSGKLISDEAGLAYPVRSGIPVLLVDEARRLGGRPGGGEPA